MFWIEYFECNYLKQFNLSYNLVSDYILYFADCIHSFFLITYPSMHVDVVLSGLLDACAYLFVLGSLADDYGGPATAYTATCDGTADTAAVASTVIGHCGRRVELKRSLRRVD